MTNYTVQVLKVFLFLHRSHSYFIIHHRYRLKGNEHFKCSNFEQALSEYTKSLKCFAGLAVFNNRALTCKYLKYLNTPFDFEQIIGRRRK